MKPIEFERLLSAFGTTEWSFASLMLSGVVYAACDNDVAHPSGSTEINGALAAVSGIEARDEAEGMLATQMVATHVAAIRALRRLRGSDNVAQQDSNGNLAVKLLRTCTMQLEVPAVLSTAPICSHYRGPHREWPVAVKSEPIGKPE